MKTSISLANPTLGQLNVAFHDHVAKLTKNDKLLDYTLSLDVLYPYFRRYSIHIECVHDGYLVYTGDTSCRAIDVFLARAIVIAMLRAEGVDIQP